MSAATSGTRGGQPTEVPDGAEQAGAEPADVGQAGADQIVAAPALTSVPGLASLDLPGVDLDDAVACGPDGC